MKPNNGYRSNASIVASQWVKDIVHRADIGAPVNDLMASEMQTLRWPHTPQRLSLRRYVFTIGVVLPVLAAVLLGVIGSSGSVQDIAVIAVLIPTVLLGLGADLYYLANGLKSVNIHSEPDDSHAGVATSAFNQAIFVARTGIARIQNWRVLAVEMGLRVILVTLFVMNVVILHPAQVSGSVQESGSYSMVIALTMIVLLTFVIEPFWRMRAVTAVGVAAVRKRGNAVNATLIAAGIVVALRIVQFLILFGLVYMVGKLIEYSMPYYEAAGYTDNGYIPIALSLGVGVGLGSLLMWIYFRLWQSQARKFALHL